MAKFYDLRVRGFSEGILSSLKQLGYGIVAVTWPWPSEWEGISEEMKSARGKAREIGLDVLFRADIKAYDANSYHRAVDKARDRFDLLCLEEASPDLIMRVNIRRVDLIDVSTAPIRALWKIRGMEVYLDLELAKVVRILKKRDERKLSWLSKKASLAESMGSRIVVTSGASNSLEVFSPIDSIYLFSSLIGSRSVNKKYVLTYPASLIGGERI